MSSFSRNYVTNVVSMNGGDGELSYANNSLHQKNLISRTLPIMEEGIKETLLKFNFPECIKVTDLGCSSGQNTFFTMSKIINTIIASYQQQSETPPEIDYCLNDLPQNDFIETFKLVPSFKEEIKGKCYISGVPGSFYTRLFPKKSIHFLHSSCSIHWLSKVPQGLEDNKNNIYIRSGCSLNVCKSYKNQFQNDFSLFLKLRSEEMLPNGRMVLTCIGKKDLDSLSREGLFFWSLLSDALVYLVSEGIVEESKANSFNLPFYIPNEGEVREIVENEGSFEINKIETYELPDPYKVIKEEDIGKNNDEAKLVGRKLAVFTRAITEPMLIAHFGDTSIINRLFDKFADNATQYYITTLHRTSVNITVSLSRK